MGRANSAPRPAPGIVAKLSVQVPPHRGETQSHLFTQTTASRPDVQAHFRAPRESGEPRAVTNPGDLQSPGRPPAGEAPMSEHPYDAPDDALSRSHRAPTDEGTTTYPPPGTNGPVNGGEPEHHHTPMTPAYAPQPGSTAPHGPNGASDETHHTPATPNAAPPGKPKEKQRPQPPVPPQ
jgi:hypothetical protein